MSNGEKGKRIEKDAAGEVWASTWNEDTTMKRGERLKRKESLGWERKPEDRNKGERKCVENERKEGALERDEG